MMVYDFPGEAIKSAAASTVLSLGSLTLAEVNHHVMRTLEQSSGELHVAKNLGLLPPACINLPAL